MKHKIATIYSCVECPHYHSDANKTRSLCALSSYQFLWWDGSPEEELGTIPDWCKLPDGPTGKAAAEIARLNAELDPHAAFERNVAMARRHEQDIEAAVNWMMDATSDLLAERVDAVERTMLLARFKASRACHRPFRPMSP